MAVRFSVVVLAMLFIDSDKECLPRASARAATSTRTAFGHGQNKISLTAADASDAQKGEAVNFEFYRNAIVPIATRCNVLIAYLYYCHPDSFHRRPFKYILQWL